MVDKRLHDLYQKVFGLPFDYTSSKDRTRMQRIIYLVQELGVNIDGNREDSGFTFSFFWYHGGPFSGDLQDAAENEYAIKVTPDKIYPVHYSEFAKNVIEKLASILEIAAEQETGVCAESSAYDKSQWLDCLAGLHFLRSQNGGNSEQAINELQSKCPHLNNSAWNQKGIQVLDSILKR